MLTDLKTAFLIAFAVLGYRFAFAPALRPIRAAILAGQPPPIGGAANRTDSFRPYSVTEVFGEEDGVGLVVVAGKDQMWNLPVGAQPFHDPTISKRKSTRDWPPIEQSGNRNPMQKSWKLAGSSTQITAASTITTFFMGSERTQAAGR